MKNEDEDDEDELKANHTILTSYLGESKEVRLVLGLIVKWCGVYLVADCFLVISVYLIYKQ